ncbi:hypothetical protein A0J61_02941 [Choanephora cucurbitarum]|uniref:Uncharacterized protein n=1 Tax=Choanephora cucurbitarum TaxID=101091 RepID=A0A1C7NJP0_9FUNG|nr:hypothetical protein A0J61_02941 [Choanephora cucurbitarum]
MHHLCRRNYKDGPLDQNEAAYTVDQRGYIYDYSNSGDIHHAFLDKDDNDLKLQDILASDFHLVIQMVKSCLIIPTASANNERIFIINGHLVTACRIKLEIKIATSEKEIHITFIA